MKEPNILVVGDVMLDRYIHGVVERISPEAPIPILRQTHVEDRPGGAANVYANLQSLGADVTLLTNLARDANGIALRRLLKFQIDGAETEKADGSITTVKQRYVAKGCQMLRVDIDGTPPSPFAHDVTRGTCKSLLQEGVSAMILSDYAGGVLDRAQELVRMARDKAIPVYVDPKGTDWSRYRGATLIKPNEAELRAVVGQCDGPELVDRGARLLRKLGIDKMLITHGAGGMTLVHAYSDHFVVGTMEDPMSTPACDFLHQPAVSGPVVDVTGAGDTVLAVVAYLRAKGFDWREVLQGAASAAGAVCGRQGTAVATEDDMFRYGLDSSTIDLSRAYDLLPMTGEVLA